MKRLRPVLTSPMISLSPILGKGSRATLSTRAQSPSSNETSSPVVVSLGHQSASVVSRLRKNSPSSWKLKTGSSVSPPASMVNTSILPCARVTINQNDRRVALFFDTFATSYAGTVIAHNRITPYQDEPSTNVSSPRLRLSVPPVRKDQVSGGQD
jgi:hypothetical protein